MSRLISQFFCNLNSSKKSTCPSGKLIIEFTSPIAKSTSPGLSDTTFFARWRNGITRMTRMTGMNWMARMTGMTVMNGSTVVTRMTEMQ